MPLKGEIKHLQLSEDEVGVLRKVSKLYNQEPAGTKEMAFPVHWNLNDDDKKTAKKLSHRFNKT